MAKIGAHSINVEIDELRKLVWVQILYKTGLGFYSIIPPEFNDQFDLLPEKEMKEGNLKKLYKSKYSQSGEFKRIAFAETENQLKQKLDETIKKLSISVIKRNPVIIISYDDRSDTDRHYDANKTDFDRLGLDYCITYCQETKIGNDKAVYNKFYQQDFLGRQETYRREIHLDSDDIVIDDTPENRLQLESIYNGLKLLIEKMNEITKNKENILKFIESKQKLIT